MINWTNNFISFVFRWNVFRARLFRESCVYHRGNYVKDLNKLGRDLQKIVIVDNSPASYIFHPDNAVSINLINVIVVTARYIFAVNIKVFFSLFRLHFY